MAGKPRTTRLGKALRDLAAEYPEHEWRLQRAAVNLDVAVVSIGVKGEGIKMLGSYMVAAKLYREVSGKDYVAP